MACPSRRCASFPTHRDRTLPPAALVALKPDGEPRSRRGARFAAARSVADPGELIRTGARSGNGVSRATPLPRPSGAAVLAARISASLCSTWRENTNSAGPLLVERDVRRHRAVGLHAAHRERQQLERMLDRSRRRRCLRSRNGPCSWRISRNCRRRISPSRCLPSVP